MVGDGGGEDRQEDDELLEFEFEHDEDFAVATQEARKCAGQALRLVGLARRERTLLLVQLRKQHEAVAAAGGVGGAVSKRQSMLSTTAVASAPTAMAKLREDGLKEPRRQSADGARLPSSLHGCQGGLEGGGGGGGAGVDEGTQKLMESAQDQRDLMAAAHVRCVWDLKMVLLSVHHAGWISYYRHRDFEKASRLFKFVDELQRHIGPKTKPSGLENDFGDCEEGDRAAVLLHDRCKRFVVDPPPDEWTGADVLSDKHF